MRTIRHLIPALVLLLAGPTLQALVNPSLQPIHLFERYNVVLAATVVSAELTDDNYDVESGRIKLEVTAVCRGMFNSKEITIDVAAWEDRGESSHDSNKDWNIWDVAAEGRTLVAFVGKQGRRGRGRDEILLYCGQRQWHHARIADIGNRSEWTYQCASEDVMVGTFNGDADRLADMLLDTRSGTAFSLPSRRCA